MQRLITIMTRRPYLAIALALAVGVGPAYALLSMAPTRPAVIGFVDLQKVFNLSNKRAEAQAELEALGQQLDDREEVLRQEIKTLQADLKLLVPGTPKHDEAEKKLLAAVADLRAWIEFKAAKLDAKTAQRRTQVYDEIVLAATEFAEQHNIDFILTDDSIFELRPGSDVQVVQQMSLRRIVYANPQFDITDELIAWINEQ
ncbi:MAG: OmpH family outer membrane protein [Planctomycetes bacterium]|nr:OmpH family outer membrane protein [Planctomycetota bacterium]